MDNTTTQNSLRGTLLVAMPQMDDPNFTGSVIYLCEHNEDGSMGIVINKPLDLSVETLFERIGIPYHPDEDPRMRNVFLGGPVDHDHGFILHTYVPDKLNEKTSIPVTDGYRPDIIPRYSHQHWCRGGPEPFPYYPWLRWLGGWATRTGTCR